MVNKPKEPRPAFKNQIDLFIEEYLEDFNGTQAAIRAGYSERTARQQASDLLATPYVKSAIDAQRVAAIAKIRKDRAKFIAHLKSRVYADMREIADWDGSSVRLRSSKDLKQFQGRLIKKVKEGKEGVEIAFKEDAQAMLILAKHFGFTKEEVQKKADDFFEDMADAPNAGLTDEELIAQYMRRVTGKGNE